MRKTGTIVLVVISMVCVLGLVALIGGSSRSLRSFDRNKHFLENIGDFFRFGWHYSRHLWLEKSRDWPAANRQRLLAYWYRPDFDGFQDLRGKSFFELGCWYQRLSLPVIASELFLRACRRDPKNRWLIRRCAIKLMEMKQWKRLGKLVNLLESEDPKNYPIEEWRAISVTGDKRKGNPPGVKR